VKSPIVSARDHRAASRLVKALLLVGVVGFDAVMPVTAASAQGFFDFLFGPRRLPDSTSSYGDPNSNESRPDTVLRSEGASSVAYCVRLCDGRFFPIQRSSGANPAQACGSVCPAAPTKTFSGSTISQAVAADGSRYTDLQNAFAFRERIVASCTCNGRDSFGLVTTSVNDDPTLRTGDIVATDDGFVAYNGGRQQKFTPVGSYAGLSEETRQHLANVKIAPRPATPRTGPSNSAGDRRVQLSR